MFYMETIEQYTFFLHVCVWGTQFKKKSSSIPEHVLLKLMKSSVKQNLEMRILFQNATLII